MRRTCALIVTILLVAVWTLPVLAQTSAPATPAPAPKPATPAAKAEPAKPAAPKAKTAAGTVKTVAPDSLVLTTGKDKDKKDLTFALTKVTKVTRDGKTAEAAKIAENDSATVTYTEADGKMTASKVTAKAPKAAKTTEAKPKS